MSQQGIVFNIQRFTIHDGPGMRTELFLKGCPLKCDWCGNPESLSSHLQLGIYSSKCINSEKCSLCVDVCPEVDALHFKSGKLTLIDSGKCTNCLSCYDACPSDSIKLWGNIMSVEDCMKVIRKDIGYYQRSGGGVTVSGGEPLLQSDFVAELFKACKEEGIHTCCESTFHANWNEINKILPYTDIFISDLKHMDTNKHKKHTGVNNNKILENLKRLAHEEHKLILRIPVIPSVNDDMDNMESTADFILNKLDGRVRTLQLLSFMRLGEEKYQSLNMPYKMKNIKFNRKSFQQHVENIAEYFTSRGIHCQIGTKEKQ